MTKPLQSQHVKAYVDSLAPRLLEVFSEAYEMGTLSPSMKEALIVTLLKPDKVPNRCESYRPLSMINIDTKIMAKIIANRLQPLVPNLVLPDQ